MQGEELAIKSIEAIKVCRITFSYNEEAAYQLNIADKITKLETHVKRLLWRGQSLKSKIMIVKTFGLNQLIYFLQCCEMREKYIIEVPLKKKW